jgi:putative acetyltransferase
MGETGLDSEVHIRPFHPADGAAVRQLFIAVNLLLRPPDMREAFDAYIERALAEEIDRIDAYYVEHGGGFWVALLNGAIVGTFGLERASPGTMELRRMYVDPAVRRVGIGRRMLQYAEDECRRRGIDRLDLSTAEIQTEAPALYRSAGYGLVREEISEVGSSKTVGSGIRRSYFEKAL